MCHLPPFSWLLFAGVWYLTFSLHGDFDPANVANESFVPCADNIKGFTSCFLFSVETQHTIGYGGRLVIICIQCSNLMRPIFPFVANLKTFLNQCDLRR